MTADDDDAASAARYTADAANAAHHAAYAARCKWRLQLRSYKP